LWVKVAGYRNAHFKAGDHLRLWHYIIGVALIVVSAVVSGSILQASGDNPSRTLTLTAGILAIIVTILTSIQTTFKLNERAELHRSAGNAFGKLKNDLEIFRRRPIKDIDKGWEKLYTIVDDITKVEAGAPGYLKSTFDRANKELQRELAWRRRQAGAPAP
jgi:SMODS and SLOG-associating 2TM effector domain family 4